MYKINKSSKNVVKLEQKLFKELQIREREHLQWIAKNPKMLGEELLIIQKEFDGFNDTNERFVLLPIEQGQKGAKAHFYIALDDFTNGQDANIAKHEFGHFLGTILNMANYIYKAYTSPSSDGHDADDESGKKANEFWTPK